MTNRFKSTCATTGRGLLEGGVALSLLLIAACGGSSDSSTGGGSGSGGSAGATGGSAGTGGSSSGGSTTGGSSSGGTGAGGSGGSAGSSGGAGAGGTGAGGSGGSGGSAGSGASGGASGSGGSGATSGSGGASTGGVGGMSSGGSAGGGTGGTARGGSGGTAGGGSGGTGGTGRCADNAGCGTKEYCAKAGCNDAMGTCTARPDSCGNNGTAVCGCDGVTYWNDCLREQHGVASSRTGQCTNSAATCNDGPPGPSKLCANGKAKCARIRENQGQCTSIGGTLGQGTCWVLPDTCPAITISGQLRKCPGGTADVCSDLCNAIESEAPHYRDNTCPV